MYLVLKVRRDHIVEDTLTKVDSKPNSDLKKPLKIIQQTLKSLQDPTVIHVIRFIRGSL